MLPYSEREEIQRLLIPEEVTFSLFLLWVIGFVNSDVGSLFLGAKEKRGVSLGRFLGFLLREGEFGIEGEEVWWVLFLVWAPDFCLSGQSLGYWPFVFLFLYLLEVA